MYHQFVCKYFIASIKKLLWKLFDFGFHKSKVVSFRELLMVEDWRSKQNLKLNKISIISKMKSKKFETKTSTLKVKVNWKMYAELKFLRW